jgi:hypothetical protein
MTASPLRGVTPPLDGRDFRWSVGTRPIPESEWLDVRATTESVMAEKSDLLTRLPNDVVLSQPGSEPVCAELLTAVLAYLRTHAADRFTASADGSVMTDELLERETALQTAPALTTIGRLVAEDFAIVGRQDTAWVLTAASICFPSRWRLSDKLGEDLAGIHRPVPGYESRIGGAVEALFDRLTPERILCRSNWTLLDTDKRHLPTDDSDATIPTMADLGWLRIERQTLRMLPESGAIVFTILTDVREYAALSAADQDALARAVDSAPADIAEYKSWPLR